MKKNVSPPMIWGGLSTAIDTESLKAKDADMHGGGGWDEKPESEYKNRKIYPEILKKQ